MSTFGKSRESGDASPARKFHTGVENFKVLAVNPTKEELEKLWGREIEFTPEYTSKNTVSDGDGEREIDQIRLDFYLTNEDESISAKHQFYIGRSHHKSQSGKLRVINAYGATAWLEEDDIKAGTTSASMSWFDTTDMRVALRGEEELVGFLVNLLNLPWDLSKVADKTEAYAQFSKESWAKIFKEDVSELKAIIDSTNNKVGVALGVKTKADGGLIQTTFNKSTVRQYVKSQSKANKFQYLLRDINETQAAGAMGSIDFGPQDLELREYSIEPSSLDKSTAEEADPFAAPVGSGDGSVGDDNDWMS
jgi:hypothetical protein